jgi:hypothetical protein
MSRASPCHGHLGDDRARIAGAHAGGHLGGLSAPAGIAQEPVHVEQARPRQDPLQGDPAELLPEEPQQILLEPISGREVGVAAFAGDDQAPVAVVLDDQSLAQPGAGGDEHHVTAARGARLQRGQLARRQRHDPVGGHLEVVEESYPLGRDGGGQGTLIDDPGQVGRHAAAVHHGSGHPQADGLDRRPGPRREELLDRGLQGREAAAGQGLVSDGHQAALALVEQGERSLGAADVPRENRHFWVPA